MINRQPKWPWRDHLTEEERQIIEAGDAAKAEWLRLSLPRQRIMNRALQRAKFAARTGAAIAFVFLASPAQAADLTVPPGMMLCHTAAAAADPKHEGCWLAKGGQRIDHINPVVTWSQIIVRSSDGSETAAVYALKADTDKLQALR